MQKKAPGTWDSCFNFDEKEEPVDVTLSPWSTKREWDKVNEALDEELKNEKPQGDAALMELFKNIYGDGSDEQKRAMIKSYQTSGGTVLSTNWDEVKDKDYEGKDKVL